MNFDGDVFLLKIPFDLLLLFNAEIFPFVFPILLSKQKWKNVFLRKNTENWGLRRILDCVDFRICAVNLKEIMSSTEMEKKLFNFANKTQNKLFFIFNRFRRQTWRVRLTIVRDFFGFTLSANATCNVLKVKIFQLKF